MGDSKSGVLPVDKPEGPTSHDVVAAARRALGTRRIGHTGTLDPFASGLLLLCVGTATRIAEYLTDLPKSYRAVARLGVVTDTDDRTGRPVAETERWRDLAESEIEAAFMNLTGELLQVPPGYSAKKVGGERAYDRARRGEAVELAPVPVTVYHLEVLGIEPPLVDFEVECSSGTYIRAIARDAGAMLGVGAHLVELRRTAIGDHDVAAAVPLSALGDREAVRRAWLDPLEAVSHLPLAELDPVASAAFCHGRPVDLAPGLPGRGTVAVAARGTLIGIAEADGRLLRPRKVLPLE